MPQVLPQQAINFFWRSFFHGSPYQQRRDLLFVVSGKLESQYRRFRARRNAKSHQAKSFLSGRKVLSL
jgi:hypothetical protein